MYRTMLRIMYIYSKQIDQNHIVNVIGLVSHMHLEYMLQFMKACMVLSLAGHWIKDVENNDRNECLRLQEYGLHRF